MARYYVAPRMLQLARAEASLSVRNCADVHMHVCARGCCHEHIDPLYSLSLSLSVCVCVCVRARGSPDDLRQIHSVG